MSDEPEIFSAAASALGYFYQPRFALYYLLKLPENAHVLIEKQDDLEFSETDGKMTLGSLKHKQPGEKLSDLATDFWKSVRVWLASYKQLQTTTDLRFFLFTTATANGPFSRLFLPDAIHANTGDDEESLAEKAEKKLQESKAEVATLVKQSLTELTKDQKVDFFSRIKVFDSQPRIEDLPSLIQSTHFRTIHPRSRTAVFERLEGWWNNEIVLLLNKSRIDPIIGSEVSDKLSSIADEYKSDNLPITFGGSEPQAINVQGDSRIFVTQLREIGISAERIRHAIIDYYRAFEQRSAWARESLLVSGEIEKYEALLTEEWQRYSAVVLDDLRDDAADEILQSKGQEIYRWAQMQCMHLRIRPRVEEAYVVRGNFQILANASPPKVYWHPYFLEKLENILGATG